MTKANVATAGFWLDSPAKTQDLAAHEPQVRRRETRCHTIDRYATDRDHGQMSEIGYIVAGYLATLAQPPVTQL